MPNPQFQREAQFILWLQWIFASAFTWIAGRLFVKDWFFSAEPNRQLLIMFAIVGLYLAVGQWLVMHRHANMNALRWIPLWMLVTAVGVGIGQWAAQSVIGQLPQSWLQEALNNLIAGMALGGLIGIVFGFVVGVAQWVVLRSRIRLAWMWIVVNVVGWGLGMQMSALINTNPIMGSLISAIVAAVVTGLWVAQLLSAENR